MNSKFNSKLYSKLLSNLRNNNTGRKFKRKTNKKHLKEYSFTVKTPIINFEQPDYTQQNLRFLIYDLIYSNVVFQQLIKQYNQFKLDKVSFFAIPCLVDGHDPAPIWIYLDQDGNNTEFNYANMPELQGSKLLPNKRFSITSYSSSGRQNDFHYWYDSQSAESTTLAIRLHCVTEPKPDPDWRFQVGFVMKFRGFKAEDTNNTKLVEDEIVTLTKNIKLITESHIENKEQANIEDKKEEDHIDSGAKEH
jgi:hypothetical protein